MATTKPSIYSSIEALVDRMKKPRIIGDIVERECYMDGCTNLTTRAFVDEGRRVLNPGDDGDWDMAAHPHHALCIECGKPAARLWNEKNGFA